MSRGRLAPSLNARSKGLVDMSLKNDLLRAMDQIEVAGASNVTTAYNNPKSMFTVKVGSSFRSITIKTTKTLADENNRDLTRWIFDPNDYADTLPVNPLDTKLPSDTDVLYIRVRGKYRHNQQWSDYGPIICVPPFDFFTTAHPVFTFTGTAPALADEPDVMDFGTMNIHLPYFSHTISVLNLDDTDSSYVAFHPGMNPTIIRPYGEIGLTGGGAPELFIAGAGDEIRFTVRMVLVNHS
jgi:hypothetical protein